MELGLKKAEIYKGNFIGKRNEVVLEGSIFADLEYQIEIEKFIFLFDSLVYLLLIITMQRINKDNMRRKHCKLWISGSQAREI